MAERQTGVTRQLGPADEGDVMALLAGDAGFGLFIASNLRSYGFGAAVRYWGQFDERQTLVATMMAANRNACVYAAPGGDATPLLRASQADLALVMGRADLLPAPDALPPWRGAVVEEHRFAWLTRTGWRRESLTPPLGTRVRQATPDDVTALLELYAGSEGFEDVTLPRLGAIMRSRVTHFRTFLAEDETGQALAAAATSAETERAAMISAVWTAPAARGQGLATAVVAALAQALLRAGMRPHLFYLADNAAAARVYARVGFRVTGDWRIWQR